jgi:hypothetical protein
MLAFSGLPLETFLSFQNRVVTLFMPFLGLWWNNLVDPNPLPSLSVFQVVRHPADEPLTDIGLAEAEGEVGDLLLLPLQPEYLAERPNVQVKEVLLQLLHAYIIGGCFLYNSLTDLPSSGRQEKYK